MDNKSTNISYLIDSLFPDHVAANYPRLIEFAKAFFEYLETQNKSSYYQNTIYLQRDVRVQDPEFAEYIKRELGILSRRDYPVDPQILYENIAQIWRSKGSEESIKTFFRLFLDDEVTIYYPWESVLIPSDGRWIVDTVIRVSAMTGDPSDFVGKRIYQIGSDATAIVDKVEKKTYASGVVYDLRLIRSTISGTFLERNTIYTDETLTAEVCRSVNGLLIDEKGSGYSVGDKIYISGYEGLSFVAFVETVDDNGGILTTRITDFGASNTPLSVIYNNTTSQHYLLDFIFYDYPVDIEDIITQFGTAPLVRYTIDTDNATTSADYGLTTPSFDIVVDTEGGSGAEFTIRYGAVSTYQGYYEGVKGQLSESIVLQDSKYYQKYSYEVRTAYTSDRWIQPLKKFAHPAGMEVVGNVYSFASFNTGIKNYYIFVQSLDEPNYVLTEAPGITTSVIGFTQTYFLNSDMYFAEDYFSEETPFTNTSIIAGAPTQEVSDLTVDSTDLLNP